LARWDVLENQCEAKKRRTACSKRKIKKTMCRILKIKSFVRKQQSGEGYLQTHAAKLALHVLVGRSIALTSGWFYSSKPSHTGEYISI
jgi:hypothetical protein